MSSFIPDDQLPPLSFGSRGFITHDGQIIGWSVVSADHKEYHRLNGTTDADFKTRWRKWTERTPPETDDPVTPAEAVRLGVWLERNADNVLPVPRG